MIEDFNNGSLRIIKHVINAIMNTCEGVPLDCILHPVSYIHISCIQLYAP